MEGPGNSTKFIDLPGDILTECLMFLDAQNLLKCMQICSTIQTLINTDIRLQYMIELYANNMVHNPQLERPEPLHSRLERLAEYQRRLRNPRLEKIDSFAQTMAFPPNEGGKEISGVIGGILIAWTKFGSLVRFTQIPSRSLGIQSSQYDLCLVDGCIVQLAVDPAQDLVVVLETTIINNLTCPLVSVRSLLTGEKHPMAAKLVCWLGDSDISLNKPLITVYGDHVALTIRLLAESATTVMVFKWKTSDMIQNIYRERTMLYGYEWLSEQYLLLAEVHHNPIALALTIVDVLNPDHPVICILNLPRVKLAFTYYASTQIRTHPPSQGILSQRDIPFFPNPENKLVLVSLSAHLYGGFIVSALASDLLKIARENTRKGSISVVGWDDWGTTHTRVIPSRGGEWSRISVYGTWALVQDTFGRLALYDFNQKLIRRNLAKQATDPEEVTMIEPTVVQNETLFMDEVKTCLPYRIAHIAETDGIYPTKTCELCVDSLVFADRFGTGVDDVDIYSFS